MTDPEQPMDQERIREARKKALMVLERMDRSETELRGKLVNAGFEPEYVDDAVDYVKFYGYLNDARYVRDYITYRSDQKSRRRLMQELQFKKGISRELIEEVCEKLEPVDERPQIHRYLEKKHYCHAEFGEGQRRRLITTLTGRGYSLSDILAVMKEEF